MGKKGGKDRINEQTRQKNSHLTLEQQAALATKLKDSLAEIKNLELEAKEAIASQLIKDGWRKLDSPHSDNPFNGPAEPNADWAHPLRIGIEDVITFVRWLAKDSYSIPHLCTWLRSRTASELGVTVGEVSTLYKAKVEKEIHVIAEILQQGYRLDHLFTFTNSLWTMWPRHATAEIHLGYHEIQNPQLPDKLMSFNDSQGAAAIMGYLQDQMPFGLKTRVCLNPSVSKFSIGNKIASPNDHSNKEPLIKDRVCAVISIGAPNSNGQTYQIAKDIWDELPSDIRKPYLALERRDVNSNLPESNDFFVRSDRSSFRIGSNTPMPFKINDSQPTNDPNECLDYGLVLVDAREAFASWHLNRGSLKAAIAGIGFHATRACCAAFGYTLDVLAKDIRDPRILQVNGIAIAAIGVFDPRKVDSIGGTPYIWKLSSSQKIDDWAAEQGWKLMDLSACLTKK